MGAPTPLRRGLVAGLALRRIRERLGLTRQHLADRLVVDVNTIAGWETGRRPLGNAKVADAHRLRFCLQVLGATAAELTALDEASRVDWVLGRAADDAQPACHPLAHEVASKLTTSLLGWPLTGVAPVVFHNGSDRPAWASAERAAVFAALRRAAEMSLATETPGGPLLRRQVYYLLAADPGSRDWLRDAAGIERRRMPRLDRWTPEWVAARSLAVSRAAAGDPEPLREFLDVGMVGDSTLAANLNYYAYWVGEDPSVHRADEFMATDLGGWTGERLLGSLSASLDARVGYLELVVRSAWTLLARRRQLVGSPAARDLGARVRELLDDPRDLSSGARSELEQINYAVGTRS